MDCSLPGSSIHGIFQARVLEWIAISFCRGSSRQRDWTLVSLTVGRRFYCLSHQGSTFLERRGLQRQNCWGATEIIVQPCFLHEALTCTKHQNHNESKHQPPLRIWKKNVVCVLIVLSSWNAQKILPYISIKRSGHLALLEAEKSVWSRFSGAGKGMPSINIILPLLISRTTIPSLQTAPLTIPHFPRTSSWNQWLYQLLPLFGNWKAHLYYCSKQTALGLNITCGK